MLRPILVASAVIASVLAFAPDATSAKSLGFHASRFAPTPLLSRTSRFHFGRFGRFGHRHRFGHRFAQWPYAFGWPYASVWPYGGLLYDDMYDGGVPYTYAPDDTDTHAPQFISPALAEWILRSVYRPCHIQTESAAVPSDGGGSKTVTIVRCVAPAAPALASASGVDPRLADVTGAGAPVATGAESARGGAAHPGMPAPVEVGGCRIETQIVPAQRGGERKITITRC